MLLETENMPKENFQSMLGEGAESKKSQKNIKN